MFIIIVPLLSMLREGRRDGERGKRRPVVQKKAGQHARVYVYSFQVLVLWVFCTNCSSRTLSSGDQLSQSGQMCREVFFSSDLPWFSSELSLLNCEYSDVLWNNGLHTGKRACCVSEDLSRAPVMLVANTQVPTEYSPSSSAAATSRFMMYEGAKFVGWEKKAAHIYSHLFKNPPQCCWSCPL